MVIEGLMDYTNIYCHSAWVFDELYYALLLSHITFAIYNYFNLLRHLLSTHTSLKGLAQAKIIKKSVILFRVLNMTI